MKIQLLYMKHFFSILTVLFAFSNAYAQDSTDVKDIDLKYLEDQFYIGVTYNLMVNRPSDVSQNNLSNGIHLGFIKDIPINEKRNKAFGIGLGYAINSYFDNIKLVRDNQNATTYEVLLPDVSFKRNKLITHVLEVPIEFRWRTSNASDHRFWRIYGGVKLGYVFANTYKFQDADEKFKFSRDDITRFQYGLMLSFGYNTWNLHAYYGLNNLFEDGLTTSQGDAIKTGELKLGLMFYIL